MTKPAIAVLGAGPIGLEAALAAVQAGHPVTVYEAAPAVGGHVADWGHVRLFTPWSMSVSPRMRAALAASGDEPPQGCDAYPTGRDLLTRVLAPLAALPALAGRIRTATRVVAVGRSGLLKHEEIATATRAARPFRLLLEGPDGRRETASADVVLDATGAAVPNALGDGGIPAPGEAEAGDAIVHRLPDLRRDAAAWAGRRLLLVGAGHSALTALAELEEVAAPNRIRVVWARRRAPAPPQEGDPLPARAALAATAARLAASPPGWLSLRTGVEVEAARRNGALVVDLRDAGGAVEPVEVDSVLALTGKVGDHTLYRQLQVHECYATAGPMKLAAALLGASGSTGGDCLAQSSPGADVLKNPEPGFFLLGQKSYGRRNDFLLRVGWEQVEQVMGLVSSAPRDQRAESV